MLLNKVVTQTLHISISMITQDAQVLLKCTQKEKSSWKELSEKHGRTLSGMVRWMMNQGVREYAE